MSLSKTSNTSSPSDQVSLKELILKAVNWFNYLWSKWLIIVFSGLLGGVLGLTYAYFKEPVYTATTTFVLEEENSGGGFGNLAGLASIAGVDLGGSGGGIFQGDNILSLYKSRSMLEQTLLTLVNHNGSKRLLIDWYIDFNELRTKWAGKRNLVNLKFTGVVSQNDESFRNSDRLMDSVIGAIVKDLNKYNLSITKPDKKLSTIQVDVIAKDEFFAKTFNNELVKKVNDFYIKTKTKKTLQNVQILQSKTDSVRAVMNGDIYTAVAVGDATPNLNPTRQVQKIAPAQRAQFSAETNKSILGEMVKNLEITKMSLLKETPLIQVIDEPIYPLEVNKLGKIKAIIFGVIISIFIASFILTIRKLLKSILA